MLPQQLRTVKLGISSLGFLYLLPIKGSCLLQGEAWGCSKVENSGKITPYTLPFTALVVKPKFEKILNLPYRHTFQALIGSGEVRPGNETCSPFSSRTASGLFKGKESGKRVILGDVLRASVLKVIKVP